MRTLVDIPDNDVKALDALRLRRRVSRSKLIREAVGDYLGRHSPRDADLGFGLWGKAAVDGVEYQRRMRSEW